MGIEAKAAKRNERDPASADPTVAAPSLFI